MNFDLTDEQQDIRRLVRDFAQQEVKPVAEELDRRSASPYELVRKLGDLGLCWASPTPRNTAARARDTWPTRSRSRSSRGSTRASRSPSRRTPRLGTYPIYAFGSEEQKQEWMPKLCKAEVLGSFGLTEPEAGSDAGNVRTAPSRRTASG